MKVELTVPSDLSEISLKQYQKFLRLQDSNEDSYFLQCKMIEIFCNLDAKNVRMLKVGDANKVVDVLNNMFEKKPDLTRTFKIDGVEYGMIPDLDNISLGEYIDLDTYISDWQNMQIAMNVLYRPIKDKIGDKYTIVDYDVDAKEKLEFIPMDIVLGSIFFFVQFRDRIIDGYGGLFGKSADGQLDASTNFTRKYGWYQSIFTSLAQNDIRRIEDITKLNVHKCLYALEYMKDKAEVEAKRIKQNFK